MPVPRQFSEKDMPKELHTLTISDVERLAKAGVAVKFEDIAEQIRPDPPKERLFDRTMTDNFWDRWRRTYSANGLNQGMLRPWEILATPGKDKINVSVHPNDGSDPFILTDDPRLYPSDALMTSLHLRETTKAK